MEQLRLEIIKDRNASQSIHHKVPEIESLLSATRREVAEKDIAVRKRQEEELRSVKSMILTEQGTRVSQLEHRINSRFERESCARVANVNSILAEVGKTNSGEYSSGETCTPKSYHSLDVSITSKSTGSPSPRRPPPMRHAASTNTLPPSASATSEALGNTSGVFMHAIHDIANNVTPQQRQPSITSHTSSPMLSPRLMPRSIANGPLTTITLR